MLDMSLDLFITSVIFISMGIVALCLIAKIVVIDEKIRLQERSMDDE